MVGRAVACGAPGLVSGPSAVLPLYGRTPDAARWQGGGPDAARGRPRHAAPLHAASARCSSPTWRPWRPSSAARSRCPGRSPSSAAQLARENGICLVVRLTAVIAAYLIADMFVDVWHLMNVAVDEPPAPSQHVASALRGGVLRRHRAQGPPRSHPGGAGLERGGHRALPQLRVRAPPACGPATTATTAEDAVIMWKDWRGSRARLPAAVRGRRGFAGRPHPLHRDVLRRHRARRSWTAREVLPPSSARRTSCTRSSAAWCRRSPHAATRARQRGRRGGDGRGRRGLG